MKNITELLNGNKNVSAWKITTEKTKSCELFYVGTKLETNRVENVSDVNVTVYADRDGKRGASSFTLYPYMDESELTKKIDTNVQNALLALTRYYDIPPKEECLIDPVKSNMAGRPFRDVAKDVAEAVFAAKHEKEASSNATEIFVYEITTRIQNSRGVDETSVSYRINIELIPTWTGEKESVEVYEMLRYGELDIAKITEQVEEALATVKARSQAVPLKLTKLVKVIIEGDENVPRLMSYFISDLSYDAKYQGVNRCNIGDSVQGENVTGDRISITLTPKYEGAMYSSSIDDDGVVLHDVEIIKDGIAEANFGSYRFGCYLGIDHPTGNIRVFSLKPGCNSIKEAEKEPYVRCVKFSGIQMEPSSGFFGGEVRLGFYFDGEKEIPVTGFSISGNMHEEKSSMLLSKEVMTSANYHGPKYLIFKGMKIA